jgi:hypothetical protein
MGVMPDADDPDHDTIRTEALWGNLMAGGAGAEWYFGYKYDHADLKCEDFRSRDIMWDQTRYALDFFQKFLPFHQMNSHNELVSGSYCLAKPGDTYAVYIPSGGNAIIDLSAAKDQFRLSWYDPRNGGELQQGDLALIKGGSKVSTGSAPDHQDKDWVVLLKKKE